MDFLFECLEKGVSPVHTVDHAKTFLKEHGFEALPYDGLFQPLLGGRYYVSPYPDVLFAFTMGEKRAYAQSLRMAFAHVDQPGFKVKGKPDLESLGCRQLNVSVYGGMMDHTWFDRPLGMAGTVMLRGKDAFAPICRRYDSARPVAVIPGLAIHMKRNANDGWKIDRQKELMPVTGLSGDPLKQRDFTAFLAEELGVPASEILHYDLNLYNYDKPALVGFDQELVCAPRLDNLASVSALLTEIVEGERRDGMNLIGLFNYEEVGSRALSGADSQLLSRVLAQIFTAIGCTQDLMRVSMARSVYLSVDGAHGAHPNYPDRCDVTTRACLGQGAAIKESDAGKYAADPGVIAALKQLSREKGFLLQEVGDRNTIRGGSTIGPMVGSWLCARGCDVGIPMWAMHSSRETMAGADYGSLCQLLQAFFQ